MEKKYSIFGSPIYFSITVASCREKVGIRWLKYVYVLCENFFLVEKSENDQTKQAK